MSDFPETENGKISFKGRTAIITGEQLIPPASPTSLSLPR